MSPLRRPFAISITGIACAYAIWKELQFVAAVALVGCLCIIYKTRVRCYIDEIVSLLGRAKTAKYKDMEIELTGGSPFTSGRRVYSTYIPCAQPWVQIMVAQLYGHQIGMILRMHKEKTTLRAEFKEEDISDLHWL